MDASDDELGEKHSLCPDSVDPYGTTSSGPKLKTQPSFFNKVLGRAENQDDDPLEIPYDMDELLSTNIIFHLRTSTKLHGQVRDLLRVSLPFSFTVACIIFCVPRATHINLGLAAKLGMFLNVFMGIMLGFCLSFTTTRWYECSTSFLSLLDAIRDLQMQCVALGVAPTQMHRIIRYGLLSAWLQFLQYDVAGQKVDGEDSDNFRKDLWESLHKERPNLVKEHEFKLLYFSENPSVAIWTWTASLIGRMAQDGEIPPMTSPTYTRMMLLIQSAHGAIRETKGLTQIQIPYTYLHVLCSMVHFNNFMNAINLGLACGVSARFWAKSIGFISTEDLFLKDGEVATAMSNLAVAFAISFFAPLMYHTLLGVALCLSDPMRKDESRLPVRRFLMDLENDLQERVMLAEDPPYWEKPCYKTC